MGEGREEQKGIETSSTVLVGLQSSRNLILLDAEGAVAVCATLG